MGYGILRPLMGPLSFRILSFRKFLESYAACGVCITFSNSPNLLSCSDESMLTRKKGSPLLSSNRLPHSCPGMSAQFEEKLFTTLQFPLRHSKLFHSQVILALGNFCGSIYLQVYWIFSPIHPTTVPSAPPDV